MTPLYIKPENITYTQMAIYIDNNVNSHNCDDNLIFEYLYHLTKMLSYKDRLFKTYEMYEEFSIYFSSIVFLRLRDETRDSVTSVLNYMKSIIKLRKIDFEKEHSDKQSERVDICNNYDLKFELSDYVDGIVKVEFNKYLDDVDKSIRTYVAKNTPYKSSSSMWSNIYTSCLLTLINSITLSKRDKELIQAMSYGTYEDRLHDYLVKNQDAVILFRLPQIMRDYILILTRKIKSLISSDISYLVDSSAYNFDVSYMLINSELNGVDINCHE